MAALNACINDLIYQNSSSSNLFKFNMILTEYQSQNSCWNFKSIMSFPPKSNVDSHLVNFVLISMSTNESSIDNMSKNFPPQLIEIMQ